jgi:hypothetical protein
MAARVRIVNGSISRKLIGLLPVLAASLAVSLSRDRPVAAEAPAYRADSESDVDERKNVVHPRGMLFGAARGKHHRRLRSTQHARRLDEVRLRHTRDGFNALGPIGRGEPLHVFKSFGPVLDIGAVDQ